MCQYRRHSFRHYSMSGVTYVLLWSPLATTSFFHVYPTIYLYRKQVIILYDRTDMSTLPHVEVKVTYDDKKGPFAIINHPLTIHSLY